jgi:TPR repeat protein
MINLSIQTLLKNDPEFAGEMLAAAEGGDVDAQYAMGLIYAEGRGAAQDEVKSYYWLTRAIGQGDKDAQTLLHAVAAAMTQEQFEQARQLVERHHSGACP